MNGRKTITGLLVAMLGIAAVVGQSLAQTPAMCASEAQLRMAMRDAWGSHARWTRSYMVSALANMPDSGRVKSRLLESGDEVADAIRPYYPGLVVPQFSILVKRNVLLAGAAVAAARGGDSTLTAVAFGKWSSGEDSLAQFLARTNTNWSADQLGAALQRYVDQTRRQVVARNRSDWMADVRACDQANIEAQAIADQLTAGLVKQFPERFK